MSQPNETLTYETCDECNGTGNVSEYDDYYHRCPECNGKGWVHK